MPIIPPNTIECPSSPTIYYYVEMTSSFAILASDHKQGQLVVNCEDLNPKLNNLSVPS
jgi:hypothetical protein